MTDEYCEICLSYITDETKMTDEEIEDLDNTPDIDGLCNFKGYPVPWSGHCEHFKDNPNLS